MTTTKKRKQEVVDELCNESCDNCRYCTLKEFLISSSIDPRVLMQFKCMEKIKYETEIRVKKKITWDEAGMIWVKEGFAKKFADAFSVDKSVMQIYHEVHG